MRFPASSSKQPAWARGGVVWPSMLCVLVLWPACFHCTVQVTVKSTEEQVTVKPDKIAEVLMFAIIAVQKLCGCGGMCEKVCLQVLNTAPSDLADGGKVEAGTVVTLGGFKSRGDLNGSKAVVGKWDAEDKLYEVWPRLRGSLQLACCTGAGPCRPALACVQRQPLRVRCIPPPPPPSPQVRIKGTGEEVTVAPDKVTEIQFKT